MCEQSGLLVAWVDGELEAEVAARVARHVSECAACTAEVEAVRNVSALVRAHAKEAFEQPRRGRSGYVWACAGAIAAGLALGALLIPREAEPVRSPAPTGRVQARETAPAIDTRGVRIHPASVASKAPRRARKSKPGRAPEPLYERVVRVSLPADALFAPGALPPGTEILAEVVLGADGSARELRVLP